MADIAIKNVTNIATLQSGDKIPIGRIGNSLPLVIEGSTILSIADDLTALEGSLAPIATSGSASDLSAGTIPDARFPSTLPAISGENLTNVNVDGGTF